MAKKSRKIYKRKQIKKSSQQLKNELIRDTQKLVNKANARLDALSRFTKVGTWASKKLLNRLNTKTIKAWTSRAGGRIKLSSNMTKTQLLAVQKATKQFLDSATSTRAGIKRIRKETVESFRTTFGDEAEKLTYDEANTLYEAFGDGAFQRVADKIGASELVALIMEATVAEDTEKDWLKRMSDYIDFTNDEDMKRDLIAIYNKFVK